MSVFTHTSLSFVWNVVQNMPNAMKPILATAEASLILVRRQPSERSEWVFTERAHGAPPLASMREPLLTREAVGRLAGADPETYWWWLADESLDAIAKSLSRDNYCVVDNFLGQKSLDALRAEVAAVRTAGRLQVSRLAGGRTGGMQTYSHSAVRGDLIAWFDGDEPGLWPRQTLHAYLQKVDTLIAQLGERSAQLAGIASRSKAMIACYPGGGARYVRHCDNSCDTGRGDRCNGRRVTAILYLNHGWWQPVDGGELRLFAPFAPKDVPPLCDVAPLANRLVLFYADYRVPHEVLPAHKERMAITTWFFDKEEHARARQQGTAAAEQTDVAESEAIEREIARFEERYGAGALRHDGVGEAAGAAAHRT